MKILEPNKWILIIVIVAILIGVSYVVISRSNSESVSVTPPSKPEGLGAKILGKLEPCPDGKSSDVQILKPSSQINGMQNKLHLNGIIKNNSNECAVKSVTLRITFSSKEQVLQEQTVNLIGEVMYPAFALQPQTTKEYKEDVIVYESLLTKTIGSNTLLPDVVKNEQVVKVEWVMPVPKQN